MTSRVSHSLLVAALAFLVLPSSGTAQAPRRPAQADTPYRAALRALNEGKVYHFFTKPCNEIDLAIVIRHALTQKDLEAKSRELLEVTRRQSVLMDEVRLTRRLRGAPREGGPPVVEKETEPQHRQELLAQMDEAVRRGRELVAALKHNTGVEAGPAPDNQEVGAVPDAPPG